MLEVACPIVVLSDAEPVIRELQMKKNCLRLDLGSDGCDQRTTRPCLLQKPWPVEPSEMGRGRGGRKWQPRRQQLVNPRRADRISEQSRLRQREHLFKRHGEFKRFATRIVVIWANPQTAVDRALS